MGNDFRNPNDFFDFLPSLFEGRPFRGKEWLPSSLDSLKADIQETDDTYIVELDLPGYNKEDVGIEYHQDMLTVKATRKEEKEERNEEQQYIRRERSFGTVSRQFYLSNVDEEQVKASYQDGVLHIELPKKAGGSGKKQISID